MPIATSASETVVASSPGDIILQIMQKSGSGQTNQIIPLKTLTWTETNGVTDEYGVGNHEKYAQVQGKKAYKIDFSLASWWVSEFDNPETWEHLLNDYLLYNTQRLSREFDLMVMGRAGEDFQSQQNGPMQSKNGIIETFSRCILTDSGGDIPEVGGTVTRKYSAVCFTIHRPGQGGAGGGAA